METLLVAAVLALALLWTGLRVRRGLRSASRGAPGCPGCGAGAPSRGTDVPCAPDGCPGGSRRPPGAPGRS